MVERQRQKRQRQLRLEDCQGMVRSRRSFIHSTVDDLSKLQKRLQKTEVATDVKKLLSVLRRLSVCAWAIYQCLNAYAPMAQTEYCLFLTLGKEITKKGSSSQVLKHIEYFAFFGISTCRACWGLVYPQSSN